MRGITNEEVTMKESVRITIEFLGKPHHDHFVLEYDKVELTQEQGVLRIEDYRNPEIKYQRNGQQRLIIKAWSGCAHYDAFEPETTLVGGLL